MTRSAQIATEDRTLDAARNGSASAISQILQAHYESSWRMAAALTGRADVARGVVKFILRRAVHAAANWREANEPTRWFNHHTLLTTRREAWHTPAISNDLLLPDASDAHFAAFIKSIRTLPMQQREAIILTHGAKFNLRTLAVAMDCSAVAAEIHRDEGEDQLRKLFFDDFDTHAHRLAQIYQQLTPPDGFDPPAIHSRVRRVMFPWVARRWSRRILAMLLLAATIYFSFWYVRIIRHSMA